MSTSMHTLQQRLLACLYLRMRPLCPPPARACPCRRLALLQGPLPSAQIMQVMACYETIQGIQICLKCLNKSREDCILLFCQQDLLSSMQRRPVTS